MSKAPLNPKLYHILHVDRLPHVVRDGFLFSDVVMQARPNAGTTIGLDDIKRRRLSNPLPSFPDLTVGGCVPFYFCPRSVMLYVLYKQNLPGLAYGGGQQPIVHLQFDLKRVADWCNQLGLRWVFTLGNAGTSYFEDRTQLAHIDDIAWNAVQATLWSDPDVKEGKQAEFLVENKVDWSLVETIGVADIAMVQRAASALNSANHRPPVSIQSSWYY